MNTHRVVRAFQGGRPYKSGEEVDASSWRNASKLVATRYLEPLPIIQQVQVAGSAPADDQKKGARK